MRSGLAKHPDKTFIGRISKGFDFLGYHFDRERLTVAKTTLERFVERATRLYEQGPGARGSRRLGMYVRRWAQRVRAGLGAPVRSAHGNTANEAFSHLRPPFTLAAPKAPTDLTAVLFRCARQAAAFPHEFPRGPTLWKPLSLT